MAFIDFYKEDAPGTWFEIGRDPATQKIVEAEIRTIPSYIQERNENRFRKTGGKRRQREGVTSPTERNNMAFANCSYAWMDCKNFVIKVQDDAGVELFVKELNNSKLKKGDEITLDGKLTDAIKWELFRSRTGIFLKIAEITDELEQRNIIEESELQENLATGLHSD